MPKLINEVISVQPVQHINPVQALMLSGGPDEGCLEFTADGCLTLPACLWRDHDVKVVRNEKKWEASVVGPNECITGLKSCICHPANTPGSTNILILACGAAYVIPAIVSIPFFLIGSFFKKIAFCIDEEANQYNEFAVDLVNHYSYQHEENAKQKYRKNINEKINLNLQINFLNQTLKEFQEVTVTGTGTIAKELENIKNLKETHTKNDKAELKNQLDKVENEIKDYERIKAQNLQKLKQFNEKINNSEKSQLI